MTTADRVWNRAAMEQGAASPRAGDRALAALLIVHGLVMNGGVHHAIETLEPVELRAGVDGYSFFGLHEVAAFFGGASDDPVLLSWTEDSEAAANGRYAEMIPDDSYLNARFQQAFRERAEEFGPVDDV